MADINTKKSIEEVIGDYRLANVVVTYIFSKGWEVIQTITDDDIEAIEGNGLVTQEFNQWIVKTAREICLNYDMIEDFIPYIANELPVRTVPRHTMIINKEDVNDWEWEEICNDLDLWDYEEEPEALQVTITKAEIV